MPMKPEIKICGIKNEEEIDIINSFDISYCGFIFADSKRKISPQKAKKLKESLRKGIKAVGVFADKPISEINMISEFVGLDILQLHSNETNEDCKNAIKPVWKMISVKNEDSLREIKNFSSASGILLDTYKKGVLGGSGESFNWEIAKKVSNEYFLILAGGLNPENIQEAAKNVNPNVLDINSGVETDGIKDFIKIELLFRRLKNVT